MFGTLVESAPTAKRFMRGASYFGRRIISYWKFYWVFRRFRDFTMIPAITYMKNLAVVEKYGVVPGIIVECGVWKGGMIAGIASILGPRREYFLFDSFDGLPQAKAIDGEKALSWQADKSSPAYHDNCKASVNSAKQVMELAGVQSFRVVAGWFEDSLSAFTPNQPIAVLRLDADWYDSTLTCLRRLYPFVAEGGLIILDDYYAWDGCARALHDFLSESSLAGRIRQYDNDVCFLIKKTVSGNLTAQTKMDRYTKQPELASDICSSN